MLAWKSDFETGSTLIDEQHRMLFDKINRLENMLKAPSLSKPEVDLLMAFMEAYTASHFKFEEQCMLQAKCPAHECNQKEHQAMLAAIKALKAEYLIKGPTRELLTEFHAKLCNWIENHIQKVDVQLRPCLKK